jgi:Major Facilitator Superfamily
LIGGLITTGLSWRAAFVFQAAVVAAIILLSRRMVDPVPPDPTRPFDGVGAVLSAVGMFFLVAGILFADSNKVLTAVFMAIGAGFLIAFFLFIRSRERAGKEPLLSTGLFRKRISNLGLVTQNIQWLLLMGVSFVVAVYLQTVRGYNAIETGVIFTAATLGVLLTSFGAERFARRRTQKTLIVAGFVTTVAGIGLLLGLVRASDSVVAFVPGLFLVGSGLGIMLTPSVNVVQSSFPEKLQGEISGLSRSVSNLGSSLGTAIAGTILVSGLATGNRSYALAMVALAGLALVGLLAALFLPTKSSAKLARRDDEAHPRARPPPAVRILTSRCGRRQNRWRGRGGREGEQLLDSVALTQEEFDAMKQRLLPNMVGAAGYRLRAETGALGSRSRMEVDTRSKPGGGTARQRLGDG